MKHINIRRLLLGCTLLLTPACAWAQTSAEASQPQNSESPAPVRELTLKKEMNLLYLPVEIHGVEGDLLVDTGAMDGSLNLSLAKTLNVTLEPSAIRMQGLVGSEQQVQIGEVDGVAHGCTKEEFPIEGTFKFFPKAAKAPLMGIIGMNDLAKVGSIIDCAKGTLQLYPKGNYKAPLDWKSVPMAQFATITSSEGKFLLLATVSINGERALMVVDTGAQNTVLTDSEFAKSAGVTLSGGSGMIGRGIGGALIELKEGIISDLKLGSIDLGKIYVVATDMPSLKTLAKDAEGEELPIVGILGIGHLKHIGAVLDCRNAMLYAPSAKPET